MSSEETINNEKLNDLIKNQIADAKTTLNQLFAERAAFITFTQVKQVELGFIQQSIEAANNHIKELTEKMKGKATELGQLEEKLRK